MDKKYDINKYKKLEEMLRLSEEEFKNLFEHVATGVFNGFSLTNTATLNSSMIISIAPTTTEPYI